MIFIRERFSTGQERPLERSGCRWYTDDIHKAKYLRRKLERKWRTSRMTLDHQIWTSQFVVMNKSLKETSVILFGERECLWTQCIRNLITKHLFDDTDPPTQANRVSSKETAYTFSYFITRKVKSIRNGLQSWACPLINLSNVFTILSELPVTFVPSFQEDVRAKIKKSSDKSCELDPMPTWLLKQYLDEPDSLASSVL